MWKGWTETGLVAPEGQTPSPCWHCCLGLQSLWHRCPGPPAFLPGMDVTLLCWFCSRYVLLFLASISWLWNLNISESPTQPRLLLDYFTQWPRRDSGCAAHCQAQQRSETTERQSGVPSTLHPFLSPKPLPRVQHLRIRTLV